jgi:hypothetical protein
VALGERDQEQIPGRCAQLRGLNPAARFEGEEMAMTWRESMSFLWPSSPNCSPHNELQYAALLG